MPVIEILVNVPILVMLGWADVVSDPPIVENVPFVALTLPALIFPVVVIVLLPKLAKKVATSLLP